MNRQQIKFDSMNRINCKWSQLLVSDVWTCAEQRDRGATKRLVNNQNSRNTSENRESSQLRCALSVGALRLSRRFVVMRSRSYKSKVKLCESSVSARPQPLYLNNHESLAKADSAIRKNAS
jgi:hypothetical protein